METGNASAKERSERVIRLAPGETALFGYGSLLSKRSLERTLARPYTGPFLTCHVKGWRRTWDAAMPNRAFYGETAEGRIYPKEILYLNVHRDSATVLNGIIFVVNSEELGRYDERESIYDRVDVTADIDVPVEGGAAYIYVCRPEHCRTNVTSSREGAIRASYVRIVETGLADLGPDFRAAYERSSDPLPEHLVIGDRT
jgi:hypothetical protein